MFAENKLVVVVIMEKMEAGLERPLYPTGASIPMGQGGQYYECPPQYFKSNIGYFSSM